ncbi:MAG: hypothetical protein GF329_14605 [Candidatus Lokiarchaeota archaeon]|nr:hypothetical protein [Candidatus Lokiarchaeota archaeon]
MKPQKKLCPRCGSPMSEKDDYLLCPVCHYTKKEKGAPSGSTGIKIQQTEVEKEVKKEKIFMVTKDGTKKADSLNSEGIYIITDPENKKIWIWKGKDLTKHSIAYKAGTESTKIKSAERMYGAKIQHVDEGTEPAEFPSHLKEKKSAETTEFESPKFYRIERGNLVKISKPVFTTGDSYVVDNGNEIFIWIGVKSSTDEKFAAALLSTKIDKERRGKPEIKTIEQGSEQNYPSFYKLVSGLKIVEKDVAESLLKPVEKETYKPVLYRVSSEEYNSINEMIYVQVPCKMESLDSEDVFVLDDRNTDTTFIWIGSRANVKEKVVGGQIARKFEMERAGVQNEVFIDEGEEPEEFTRLLNGN